MELTLEALADEGIKPSIRKGWEGNLMKHTIKRVVTDGYVLLLTKALKKGSANTLREDRAPDRPHEVSIESAIKNIFEPAVENNTIALEYDGIYRETDHQGNPKEDKVYCRFTSTEIGDRIYVNPWKMAYILKSLTDPKVTIKASSHARAAICALTVNQNGMGCVGLIMPLQGISE